MIRLSALLAVLWSCDAAAQIGPSLGSPTGPAIGSRLPSAIQPSATAPTPRAAYYVDSVSGSDAANPCTAIGSPCATIARLLAVAPPADSNVYLKRGSYWREQIHVAGYSSMPGGLLNGTQVLAYGAGARPILDAADVIPAGSWTKTAGRTNVYQANVTISASWSGVRAGMGNRIWENGVKLAYVADVATCDATPGSWTGPTRPTAGPDTFYVHSADNSNPAASGKVYEWPARPYGVYGGQYVTDANRLSVITGVETRNHGHHDGGILSAGYVSDFVVDTNGAGPVDPSHGLWCNGTCEDGTSSSVVSFGNNMPPVTIRRVSVTCDSAVGATEPAPHLRGTGFYFHTGSIGANKHAKMTYEDVSGVYCAQLLGGDAATQVLVNGATATANDIYYFGAWSNIDRLDLIDVRWVRHDIGADTNGILLSNVPRATICGGRFVSNRVAPYGLISADATGNTSLSVIGSTFAFPAGQSTAKRQAVANRTPGATVSVTRSLFYDSGATVYAPSTTAVTANYNVVDTTAVNWDVNGTPYANWTAWRAGGFDAASTQEAVTMAGDITVGNVAPVGGSAAWTMPAGADAYGDTYCAAYALTIP